MSASRRRVFTVARREFLTTVRRRAFLLTLLGTPAYFAFITFISASAEVQDKKEALKGLETLGVVDSSGRFGSASHELETTFRTDLGLRRGSAPALPESVSFRTRIRFYDDAASAQAAVRTGEAAQAIVIPGDYVETGRIRRYARPNSPFSSADKRVIAAWLARNLVAGQVDERVAARVAKPAEEDQLFTLARDGRFELKDEAREIADFLVPMFFSLLLGLSIIIGGQYLLQGVAEEKESRILESLMCQVSAEELMAGKLFGLGAVGLVTIGAWVGVALGVSVPVMAMLPIRLDPVVVSLAVLYFLFGYLFFGSIMTGIGAITNNMREAQQFAVWFSFAPFVPFILVTVILSKPDGPLPFWLSLFPPTAATTMMLRLGASNSAVPGWQIALSLLLLAGAGLFTLRAAARVFRIGLLMYGKTPTLPEILRWARRA